MKKILRNFPRDLIFGLSRDLPLEGQKNLPQNLATKIRRSVNLDKVVFNAS